MLYLEEIKQCKSYADAIRLIFNKNYTNGKLQEAARKWCFDNYNFDLEKHLEEYKNRKVYCLECGKEIEGKDRFRKKFCSSSCAATYGNKHRRKKTQKEKDKISESLIKHYAKENNVTVEEYLSIKEDSEHLKKYKHTCKMCGSEFWSRRKNVKYCSPKCSSSDPEVKQKIKVKIAERIENGTFSGWKSRNLASYPEQFWMRVLDNNNISYIREDFSTKKYFLDFLIEKNNVKIDLEIDGKQHTYEDRKDHDKERDKYLMDLGFIIYRIPWNEINSEKGKEEMSNKINVFLDWFKQL